MERFPPASDCSRSGRRRTSAASVVETSSSSLGVTTFVPSWDGAFLAADRQSIRPLEGGPVDRRPGGTGGPGGERRHRAGKVSPAPQLSRLDRSTGLREAALRSETLRNGFFPALPVSRVASGASAWRRAPRARRTSLRCALETGRTSGRSRDSLELKVHARQPAGRVSRVKAGASRSAREVEPGKPRAIRLT